MPLTICDNMVPFMFPYLNRSRRRQRTTGQTNRQQTRSRTFTQIVVRYRQCGPGTDQQPLHCNGCLLATVNHTQLSHSQGIGLAPSFGARRATNVAPLLQTNKQAQGCVDNLTQFFFYTIFCNMYVICVLNDKHSHFLDGQKSRQTRIEYLQIKVGRYIKKWGISFPVLFWKL